jgi:hypothetical protein
MKKNWLGYVASGLIFLSGILEWAGGYMKLGIFLIVISIVSFFIRIYMIKKINGKNNNP